MCLGVNAIALVLNVNFRKLGCLEWRWLGGIYSLEPLPSRWLSLLSMGTPNSPVVHRTWYCSPSDARHVSTSLGFGAVDRWNPLSCSYTGHVRCGTLCCVATPDMSGAFWLRSLTSDFCTVRFYCPRCRPLRARLPLLGWLTGHVRCTPDNLVNYRGERPGKSREWLVGMVLGLGHRALSGAHRTLSGAPLAAHSQVLAPNFV
jgi:hypothetical protein